MDYRQSYYRRQMRNSYPMQDIYSEEIEYERDMERMKQMYPDKARLIQRFVEDECDKMEYEGSMMFDEYTYRTTCSKLC